MTTFPNEKTNSGKKKKKKNEAGSWEEPCLVNEKKKETSGAMAME